MVIEVHYYRDRPKTSSNLHKDTLGQTMFVNLNYTNEKDLPGPEWVENPPLHETHEQLLEENLPPQFLKDLEPTRDLGKPTLIKTGIVPPSGVVSFVDETIHHATPLLGHRDIKLKEVRKFMSEDPDFAELYPVAMKAYTKSQKKPSGLFKKFQSTKEFKDLFKVALDETQKDVWRSLMELCSGADGFEVNRPTLLHHGMLNDQIDRLLSGYGPSSFNSVNIPSRARKDGSLERLKMTTDDEGKKPLQLTRQMSQRALTKDLPVDPGGERRFFRTWVRAVKTGG